jgi:hypothetical protein
MPIDYVIPFVDCTMASLSLRDKREEGRWKKEEGRGKREDVRCLMALTVKGSWLDMSDGWGINQRDRVNDSFR